MFPIIISLFVINLAYITYFSYVTLKMGFQVSKRIPEPDMSQFDQIVAKRKTKAGRLFTKILIILLAFVFVIVILGISLYFIWVPILVWNTSGPMWGIFSLVVVAFSDTYLKILLFKRKNLNAKLKELLILSDSIKYFAIIDALLLFTNLEGQTLYQILLSVYQADFFMKTAVMVFIPTAYSVLLLTNIFVIMKRTKFLLNKNLDKYKATSKRSILLVVVFTSFFGLFYLNQLDLSFVSAVDAEAIRGGMNTYGVLLSAVFIPLFLDALQNRPSQNNGDPLPPYRPYRRMHGVRPYRGLKKK